MMSLTRESGLLAGALLSLSACAAPVLSQDGQLVFQQRGAHGASVLTAHGVEFLDRTEIPSPVERHSVDDPWVPATGFLLPKDGVFHATSSPVSLDGPGLAVVVRTSDVLVPSWGGEVLLRIDAIAPAEAFPTALASVRAPIRLAIVLDGHGANTAPLARVALEDLGAADRVAIIDTSPPRAILPLVPGSHRTLALAAMERATHQRGGGAASQDLASALAIARGFVGASDVGGRRHVLVVSDGGGIVRTHTQTEREAARLLAEGTRVTAIASPDRLEAAALAPLGHDVHAEPSYEGKQDAIAEAIPPPGDVVLEDVTLTFDSAPAPARVIEASGGQVASAIAADKLYLGDMYAGEARVEMARVGLPRFVAGEPLDVNITARYRAAGRAERHFSTQTIFCRYADDVEAIANARNGDVIAYGSALAMVRRLDRAFLGSEIDKLGGLRPLVRQEAQSLAVWAEHDRDPALFEQAEILATLLGAIDE